MGKDWDKSGIAFQSETWAGLKELMLPGAFGMAFASARGWHRLAVAIEDAGFRIHPSIFGWLYASGFPKATRIDTQIDKKAGISIKHGVLISKNRAMSGGNYSRENKHIPATPLAKTWASHRYGLQALKPALEPIVVFQKPYEGKPVDSIIKTGAGAFNIDGARIPHHEKCRMLPDQYGDRPGNFYAQGGRHGPTLELKPQGRWPANFYLDEEAARRLGKQSGTIKGCADNNIRDNPGSSWKNASHKVNWTAYNDTGTAARFFLNVDWKLEHSDPVLYCPKASRKERDAGLDAAKKPLYWSSGTQNPGSFQSDGTDKTARNPHPTLKPIRLTQWLSSLLLPPEEYAPRRILIPFAGSGSEMIGAILAGWDVVIGVEMEKEYVEIAKARLKYWAQKNQPRLF